MTIHLYSGLGPPPAGSVAAFDAQTVESVLVEGHGGFARLRLLDRAGIARRGAF